jgi:hypothetical protein
VAGAFNTTASNIQVQSHLGTVGAAVPVTLASGDIVQLAGVYRST